MLSYCIRKVLSLSFCIFTITERLLTRRLVVNYDEYCKHTDHGNDVMVHNLFFSLLSREIFRETLTVMDGTSKFVNAIRVL